ncbi:hypothetical protein BJY01DRAFT_248913 [Aspergillus pseudoustus]|uniref:ABM domain-containing protein n=1 Tax=Aspergillus pseudoustus TaxID=1810923 RepID=A0ABR4JT09_9EURO
MHVPTNTSTATARTASDKSHLYPADKVPSPPLDTPTAAVPTQIITFSLKKSITIEDANSFDGTLWKHALDILENSTGFRKLYWGRHVEEAGKVQVHVVRDHLNQHYAFLTSPEWTSLTTLLKPMYPEHSQTESSESGSSATTVLHTLLSHFTHNPRTISSGAPVTGTAIYLTTSRTGWEKTWALWTTIVPNVKGCLGCTGGWIVEPVDGHDGCYVVYVGWASIEDHDAYHHTRDFGRKRVVLALHNVGWRGYGHVRFLGEREKAQGKGVSRL